MVFVNQIASIVHYATNKCAGAANKNVGDAFLLVWRLTPEDSAAGVANGVGSTEAEAANILEMQLMDNALFAFLKVSRGPALARPPCPVLAVVVPVCCSVVMWLMLLLQFYCIELAVCVLYYDETVQSRLIVSVVGFYFYSHLASTKTTCITCNK